MAGIYKYLTPVEIVEYLCQGSANGFPEVVLAKLEKNLDLSLPAVLRDFLLCAGRERICVWEKEIFPLDLFRKMEGYLVIGNTGGKNLKGIKLEDAAKDNPPVYVLERQGKWELLALSVEDYLLAELDRRIRRTKISGYPKNYKEYLGRYFYCEYLSCKEWTLNMASSEIYVPQETWGDIFPEKEERIHRNEGQEEEQDDWGGGFGPG